MDPLLRIAFSRAIVDLFWVGAALAVVGLALVLALPELPLRQHHRPEPVAEPGEGEGERDPGPEAAGV